MLSEGVVSKETAEEKAKEEAEEKAEEKAKAEVLESKIMNSMIVKLYNKCIRIDKDIPETYGTPVTVTTYSSLKL